MEGREAAQRCGKEERTEAVSESPLACGWVGKLTHDRSQYADWGWLRDESGELVAIVKMPFMEDEELHQHRRNGTDPTQGRVDAILAALYGHQSITENTPFRPFQSPPADSGGTA